ncbi:unnamed protein product [Allacma fusca]|uniref:Uncharacterized protein n=1 Tax=Allacma fusca TaxID=39272 RepID=A0A8J2MAW6_9HEXA|nr:unnamed protein product [Allacma fusca]
MVGSRDCMRLVEGREKFRMFKIRQVLLHVHAESRKYLELKIEATTRRKIGTSFHQKVFDKIIRKKNSSQGNSIESNS